MDSSGKLYLNFVQYFLPQHTKVLFMQIDNTRKNVELYTTYASNYKADYRANS